MRLFEGVQGPTVTLLSSHVQVRESVDSCLRGCITRGAMALLRCVVQHFCKNKSTVKRDILEPEFCDMAAAIIPPIPYDASAALGAHPWDSGRRKWNGNLYVTALTAIFSIYWPVLQKFSSPFSARFAYCGALMIQ
jgi:hypothetical protein